MVACVPGVLTGHRQGASPACFLFHADTAGLLVSEIARDWGVQRGANPHGIPAQQIWFELGKTGTGAPGR